MSFAICLTCAALILPVLPVVVLLEALGASLGGSALGGSGSAFGLFCSSSPAACLLWDASAASAFLVSASISFWISLSRCSSQPLGSQSPGQPHLAFLAQKQVPPVSL